MGQNQGSYSNPLLAEWAPHPGIPNIYFNIKTNEQAQSHLVTLTKNQQSILRKRLQQNHNFITKILYLEPTDKTKILEKTCEYFVYTEKLLKLSRKLWVPTNSSLSILKGFRRLSSSYGFMKVTPNMIKVTESKQIRVWINQNPLKNEINTRVESQQLMLTDILQIIAQYDPNSENYMKKCTNINEAINKILHNMTEGKNHINYSGYSYRGSKNEDKGKTTHLSVNYSPSKIPAKKSRDVLESPNKKIVKKDGQGLSQLQLDVNKVHLLNHKSPNQIKIEEKGNQKIQQHFHKKTSNFQINDHENSLYNRSEAISREPETLLNNCKPIKTQSKKSYKPFDYQVNQQKQETKTQILHDAHKFKQFLHKNNYILPDHRSNLERSVKQKPFKTQENHYINSYKGQDSQMNQNSETGTERQRQRQMLDYHPKYSNISIPYHLDQNRTKTQKFYENREQSKLPQRAKTNYLSSQTQDERNQINHYYNHNKMKSDNISVTPSKKSSQKYNMKKVVKNNEAKIESVVSTKQQIEENKKIIRIKQAEKIKQEMSCLGIENNTTKQLTEDKSQRDLLIKQKVEEKNNKHKELKFQITKLLSQ